jgi:hypothetical protein
VGDSALSFICGLSNSALYTFQPLPGGSFTDSHGEAIIIINTTSAAFGILGGRRSHYCFCTYYIPKELNSYEAHITITPSLELQLQKVRKSYAGNEEGPSVHAWVKEDEVSLSAQPEAGVHNKV